jgi:hypothetical protein
MSPTTTTLTAAEIAAALAEPFDLAEIHWKPQAVSGNRALAIAFVNARTFQDRLDAVLGVECWQDDYACLEDGSVVCRLRVRFGNEWIVKADVGTSSEQPDEGDRRKAAFSDALKRAAVKLGVGRYLYRLPSQWCDWDVKRKQFVSNPKLPPWALPAGKQPPPAKPANGTAAKPHTFPEDGTELENRLADYDQDLSEQGLFAPGDLLRHVHAVVAKAGPKSGITYGTDVRTWPKSAI